MKCECMKEKIIVTIENLDHHGRGIAHFNNKVVFVENACTKEVVEIEIFNVKKKYMEARIVQVITPSKDRIESPCPYFLECGGCDLLHLDYQKQLEYKENKVREIVKKFASLENVVKPIVPNETVFGYRNKVTFAVNQKIGFYKKKSNQIIEIENCLLLSKKMNFIYSVIKRNMNKSFVKQVMIRDSQTLDDTLVVFEVEDEFQVSQIPLEQLSGISILVKRKNDYEVVSGKPYLVELVLGYTFKISPASFFQVNTRGMERLYQTVLDCASMTGLERVLDLYCGTGTIGICLSEKAKKVLGIEINQQAIEDAIWNKKQNGISNIEFLCGDTGSILKETSFQPDLVVVDPPRAGLDELAIEQLKKINAPKMIYVSCDPVTLARDIKRLENHYEVNTIIPVDMFSNTYHVECVCLLKLR